MKVLPGNDDDSVDKLDQLLLSSAICNNEDLGPFIRKAFASGKPEILHHYLRHFDRSKEYEIEEVCKVHYQDFILAVDDLRSLLSDVDSLKSSLSAPSLSPPAPTTPSTSPSSSSTNGNTHSPPSRSSPPPPTSTRTLLLSPSSWGLDGGEGVERREGKVRVNDGEEAVALGINSEAKDGDVGMDGGWGR